MFLCTLQMVVKTVVFTALDSWMDCLQVRTRSLLWPSQATALHASHNSFSASTNFWNDLAKASIGRKNTLAFCSTSATSNSRDSDGE